MPKPRKYNKLIIFISFILAYYLSILIHQYAHGFMAWIYDLKEYFFDIRYGNWFLTKIDEDISYNRLMALGHNKEAAYISIVGLVTYFSLFVISLIVLLNKKILKRPYLFCFFYWLGLIALIPIFNYIPIRTFSKYSDIGRFAGGLNISPWWIFIIGTPVVLFGIWLFFYEIVPRAYLMLFMKKYRKLFLFGSAAILFWGIFVEGFDSLTDTTIPVFSTIVAWVSLFFPFLIFIIFNPSNELIKKKISLLQKKYY